MIRFTLVCSLAVAMFACTESRASILWDYSPANFGVNEASFQNQSDQQNCADQVIFAQNVQITGMDIYSSVYFGYVGQSITIRLWSEVGILLDSFTTMISVIDSDGADVNGDTNRKHADFATPLSLSADTVYWIGMSGTTSDITQADLAEIPPGGDGRMELCSGTTLDESYPFGDMAFRLEGNSVPEPSTLIIWSLLGGLAIGLGWWRKRKAA
jgi:hypothetical protein